MDDLLPKMNLNARGAAIIYSCFKQFQLKRIGEQKMKSNRQLSTLLILVLGLIAIMVIMNSIYQEDENPNLAGAEFFVS
jgi:hypothetical protein